MPDAPAKVLYYPVWASTHPAPGHGVLYWGRPCDDVAEAARLGVAEVRAGNASVAFVVEFRGGAKTPLPEHTYPRTARTVVRHWESLWDATDGPES